MNFSSHNKKNMHIILYNQIIFLSLRNIKTRHNMSQAEIENFKIELRALLEKYNANISCVVDGDTHGLSYEMVVDFGQADRWKEYKLNNNSHIDKTNCF